MSTKAFIKFMDASGELLIEKPHDGKPENTIPWLYDYIELSDVISQKGIYEIVNYFIKNNEFVQLIENITNGDNQYYYDVDLITKEISVYKKDYTKELRLIDIHKVQKTCENVNRWL